MSTTTCARYRGCLLGLAVGDALGTTLEFSPPGTFEPIIDMVGGGPFRLRPGEWTDDTSMALCLAESLLECAASIPSTTERYVRWSRDGHLSSTDRCFDIGNAIPRERSSASSRPVSRGAAQPIPSPPVTARSCGSRPVALAYARDRATAIQRAEESSRTTHQAATAVDACRSWRPFS